ncbi:preprotein translocase subunit SecE [Silanimonas sp.]|uniref:preprotein translocase subunit SecE n=1 Tax=Silanimonas sp. TaxID=1929290 RepID=UPI001BC375DF|nr:preprotein translocase subunit SecE [Silanimonas sp.]MBS3895260.1 preprotein translocase subunit SecE [Silanimonas sp.]
MNTKVEPTSPGLSPLDLVKYLAAILLVVGGIAGWYLLEWATPLRVLLVILSVIAAVAVAAFTAKGREAREFIEESTFELRKVVWPTTDETTRTTIIIMIVVVIVSLILAGFDWVISLGVRALLGQGDMA